MQISQHYYLIIDLEATCCDDNSFPRQEMEIIEIGAVMLDAKTLEVVSEFQSFVQPVQHPQLTSFCTKLTSIQQSHVDAAPKYPEVHQSMIDWLSKYDDWMFCSWGAYDARQFESDCQYHQLEYPFGLPIKKNHLNLKIAFSEVNGFRKRFGMQKALSLTGLELQGTHHRGIDDARNIARIVRMCLSSK